ncbi:uncharacterized protein LOC129778228 [Toxorhynchites rutilus septentrionalis]|uniref:uncharacterized protein LOC129778228 n=1 Tax=Toxorhynchites rutilus septentrionalis TaxID=329112 RepID=UPI0024786F6D|nr:uncharacterized protein LOC129778228 [Toxorhynchites rutilus septentrionalis]
MAEGGKDPPSTPLNISDTDPPPEEQEDEAEVEEETSVYEVGSSEDEDIDEKQDFRPKEYHEGSKGPFIVYFRRKSKPLNVIRISKELTQKFSAVTEITRMGPDKLRVVVSSRTQANEITRCDLFAIEYRVYVPCCNVEIDGVITEKGLTRKEIIDGVGRFKYSSLKTVKILACDRLKSVSQNDKNDKRVLNRTNSFRVTFEGSALPNYVAIGALRLPVRLFVPRVMKCNKCMQLGHTTAYCCNKKRCADCGDSHDENPCAKEHKCLHCGGTPHDLIQCPVYKQRGEKIKRSLKERSKRTYAEMLKNSVRTNQDNPYSILQNDEPVADAPNAGSSGTSQGAVRKRKITSFPSLPRKTTETSQVGMKTRIERAENRPKQVPPGLSGSSTHQGSSALPGAAPTPSVPFSRSRQQPQSGLLALSDLVDNILNALNINDPLKSIVLCLLPIVRTFLKEKCGFLAAFISLDA